MTKSSTSVFAILAALGTILPNHAEAQTTNWSGFYVGAHAGLGWGDGKLNSSANCPANGYFCDTGGGAANAVAVGAAGTGSASTSAFNGGIQAGYNVQAGTLVYGGEIDFGSFGLKVSGSNARTFPVSFSPASSATGFTVSTAAEANWLSTFRGRIGFTSGNFLFYLTGGLALADIKVSNSYRDDNSSVAGGVTGSSSHSTIKAGWVLGGGTEIALSRNWSLKGEYLYVDLGKVSTTTNIAPTIVGSGYSQALTTKADLNAHTARLGVNYKF